jgi:hypothetical protein
MIAELERAKPVLVCEHQRSVLTVYQPARPLFVTVARGDVVEAMADRLIELLEREVAAGTRQMSFFHDWWEMENYQPSSRQKLTDWRRGAPPGTTKESHVLVRSKLVAMGVAASSIVLRMINVDMRAYASREPFERELRKALSGSAT